MQGLNMDILHADESEKEKAELGEYSYHAEWSKLVFR